jgi:hypothetical protein
MVDVADAAGINAAMPAEADGAGSAWGDYDLDGDLDLFVAGYVQHGENNRLIRNNGDGSFTDVTLAAGLSLSGVQGFGGAWADMNGDGWPELLLVADFGQSRYFANNRDGTFSDRTATSGTGLDGNGMGQAVLDFNGDGLLDWYVTSIDTAFPILPVMPGTGNMLYRGTGEGIFVECANPTGVRHGGWGWGAAAFDLDLDGWEDIVATNGSSLFNGAGQREWVNDPTVAFRNRGDGTFDEIGAACGLGLHTAQGRGLATLDIENDGDLDVLIVNSGGSPSLFRSSAANLGGEWLRVFVDTSLAERTPPDGVGLRVSVRVGERWQHRAICAGPGYLLQGEASAHFGLGGAQSVDELAVHWPRGGATVLRDTPSGQIITVRLMDVDWNRDAAVDVFDLLAFLSEYFRGSADVNGDSVTDREDLRSFVHRWLDARFAM